MNSGRNFFYDLSERVRQLIAEAIDEKERDWLSFVKVRRNEISLSAPGQESGNSRLQLQFLGYETTTESEGSFAANTTDDDILIYRYPSKMTASYLLQIKDMDLRESLQIFDGLSASFFNKKSIDNYIPESFRTVPDLVTKMSSPRAELSLKKAGASAYGYEMRFEYKGLYHSGDPLRVERRVKQRTVNVGNNKKSDEGVL